MNLSKWATSLKARITFIFRGKLKEANVMKISIAVAAVAIAAVSLLTRQTVAQGTLNVQFGSNGIQQLSYNGVVLEDLNQYPSDTFHIWHMKMTDLSGNVVSTGQYGWGENNNGRSWNVSNNTWTYNFVWGSLQVQFLQHGSNLDMNVTETNLAGSGVILDGAVMFPLALHLPALPPSFYDPSYPQLAFNTTGPSVVTADYGSGEIVSVVPNATKPLYSGFWPTGNGVSYFPIISGTTPEGLATFQPHNDRPVQPGQTDTFTVSLRFAPSGTSPTPLAGDTYANWASTWPPQLNWTDRRPIGSAYLASSPSGNINQPGGFPNNPRRYFNDGNASDFDITTATGLAAFQVRVLQQATNSVVNMRQLGAQGAITWDIEGEEYPQSTSYVCEPDLIAQIAPEMESIISDSTSPYAGMKLDDAYFKTMTDAGFRVGVCARPQHFTLNGDGTAQQVYLADSAVAAELIQKMKYAHDRWGATLFYVDSTVETDGAVLDASIFQQVAAALPDSLIVPEETTPKHYAYTAPFQSFLFHGDRGTDPTVYAYYPHAFSVNLINDADPGKLAAAIPQLTASVKAGDILMGHVEYWQANDPTIVSIYQAAGVSAPVVTPAPAAPTVPTPVVPAPAPLPVATTANVAILTPNAGATLSGVVSVSGAINVNLDAAGSYLMVDGAEIGTNRVGSAPFNYALDTTTLTNAQHSLQLWAHDTNNVTSLSAPVPITVSNLTSASTPQMPAPVVTSNPIALTYPVTGQPISGILQIIGNIPQTLDAAGSFLLVDGVEWGTQRIGSVPYLYPLDTSALSPGSHTLQLWAHDINNSTLLSNEVMVQITQ
jgi:hypothetical protein